MLPRRFRREGFVRPAEHRFITQVTKARHGGLAAGAAEITVPPDVVFYYDQHPEWLSSLDTLPRPDFDAAAYSGDDEPK